MKHLSLRIKGTAETPTMEFKPHESLISMIGVSVPSNAKAFYEPILIWLEEFVNDPPQNEIVVKIDLRYFSVSSSVVLLKIFKLFQKVPKIKIYWYYEDVDMKEAGENYESMLTIPFVLIQKDIE